MKSIQYTTDGNVYQNSFALNNFQYVIFLDESYTNSKYLTEISNILISTEYSMGGVFV